MPRTSDLFNQVGGAKIFSKLDLQSGYHYIKIKEEDVRKTTIGTRYGQYEFVVPISCPEGCFTYVFFFNPDLVITRLQIYLGEYFSSPHLIK